MRIKSAKALVFLTMVTLVSVGLMPPEVYRKQIAESEIMVLARVKAVNTTEVEETYVTKEVELEVLASYGKDNPGKTATGICYSAGKKDLIGGKIFYYPHKGDTVFVTMSKPRRDQDANADNSALPTITSYTFATPELISVLKKNGVAGLEFGIGKVSIKGQN